MTPFHAGARTEELHRLAARYTSAAMHGSTAEALRLLDEEGLERGFTPSELADGVVRAAQEEVGRLWENDRVTVAHEHLATAVAQVALVHLLEHDLPAPPSGRRVVFACVEGERHDMPARLAADALVRAGLEVHFLGADVPTGALLALLRVSPPDLLALSATLPLHRPAVERVIASVRAEFGDLPILLGGAAMQGIPGTPSVRVGSGDPAGIARDARAALGAAP